MTLKKTTSLIGNYPEQVWGTGWHADTAVTLNECASTTYSPATCDAANQKAVTLGTGNLAGTFKGQVIDLAAGVIDTNGDKCGVAGATTCYVVVVGNSGDSTASVTLGFTLPTLSIHKSTLVLGNYVNAVKVGGIPIGDSVLAVECDVSVSVPAATVSASNCDDATEIFGTSAANGKVVFTSAGVPMKVNGAYSDGASGACLTGGTCTILVQDFSNASFDATVAVAFATPTLSVHTITNALGNYVDAVKAAGFPIGDTVDATECDSGVTVPNPAAAHCDGATQISGPVGTNGRVTFTALGVPLAVGGAFSDAAAGTCPAGGTCEIVANDAGNTGVGLDEAVTFASPTATLHESTNIPANFVDNVGAASFPIGNTVTATECDTTVTPANQGTNCDSSTQITGTVATNGKVIFSPSGIKMLSSSSYTDGAAGAPGNVVVNDSTHSGFYIAIPVTMAG